MYSFDMTDMHAQMLLFADDVDGGAEQYICRELAIYAWQVYTYN